MNGFSNEDLLDFDPKEIGTTTVTAQMNLNPSQNDADNFST